MAPLVPSAKAHLRQWAAPLAKGPVVCARGVRGLGLAASLLVVGWSVSGCQRGPSAESQRLDRVDLRIQQLEQRINKLSVRSEDGADKAGKPPAGVIKSLTLRMGSEDDRLRIYWADGSKTDLPCTKEQSTFVCG